MRRDDWLIQQLPVGMVDDDFLVRFLSIFQDVANTVLHTVDTVPHLFDTAVAPDSMVRAIGGWVGIDWIDPSLPDALQRQIVREYSGLLPWRGTKRGLVGLLELISGGEVTVEDNGGVYIEGEAPRTAPHVKLTVESSGWATEKDLLRIVRDELPATVTFELTVGGRLLHPDPVLATADVASSSAVQPYDYAADERGTEPT